MFTANDFMGDLRWVRHGNGVPMSRGSEACSGGPSGDPETPYLAARGGGLPKLALSMLETRHNSYWTWKLVGVKSEEETEREATSRHSPDPELLNLI